MCDKKRKISREMPPPWRTRPPHGYTVCTPSELFGMWYMHISFIYDNYLYVAHLEMINEIKYVHPCGTHMIFQKKICEKIQLWEPCVPFGCTYFMSLYISERFRYGSLPLQSITFLCKVEMDKCGGEIQRKKMWEDFSGVSCGKE